MKRLASLRGAGEAAAMRVVEECDAGALLAEAQPLFAAHEVEYNLPLGVLQYVVNGQRLVPTPWLWGLRDGERLVGLAMRTPPLPLVISPLPEAACAVLAEAILARGSWPLPLNGPREVIDSVTAHLTQRASTTVELLANMRLFELRQVISAPRTTGAMRRATQADAPVLVDLFGAFEREALPAEAGQRDLPLVIDGMLAAGRAFLWQDDAVVGAMAVFGRRTGKGASIGGVYAPPALRRRGYATALVSALSQHMLNDGCEYTCLLTDLANPTSNSIYRKIGYQPVCDLRHVRVSPA